MIGYYICESCDTYRVFDGEWHADDTEGGWSHVTGRDEGPCPACGNTDISVTIDDPFPALVELEVDP